MCMNYRSMYIIIYIQLCVYMNIYIYIFIFYEYTYMYFVICIHASRIPLSQTPAMCPLYSVQQECSFPYFLIQREDRAVKRFLQVSVLHLLVGLPHYSCLCILMFHYSLNVHTGRNLTHYSALPYSLHSWGTRGSGTLRDLSKVTQPIRDHQSSSQLPHPTIVPLYHTSLVSHGQENIFRHSPWRN